MNVKQIQSNLCSKDEKKIETALLAIEDHGDASLIIPLADLLLNDIEVKKYQKKIIAIFESLKDTKSVQIMMGIIHDQNYRPIRSLLLASIWNTTLDYTQYVADFVYIACSGTLVEAFDCLTILENIQGEIQEEQLLEAQWHLKEYTDKQQGKIDEQKGHIISDIAQFLKDTDLHIQG